MDSSNYNSGSDFCSVRRLWDRNMTYIELYCGCIQTLSIFCNKWNPPELKLQAKFSTGTWNSYDIPNTVQTTLWFLSVSAAVWWTTRGNINCYGYNAVIAAYSSHRHCYTMYFENHLSSRANFIITAQRNWVKYLQFMANCAQESRYDWVVTSVPYLPYLLKSCWN